MSSYTTSEIRSGMKVILEGDPYAIVDNEFVKPGKGQAFNRIKVRNLKRFLTEGDKTKITLRFRGREMAHTEIGEKLMHKFCTDLEDVAR